LRELRGSLFYIFGELITLKNIRLMSNDSSFIMFVGGILSIVAVIVFFVMANNMNRMRKDLADIKTILIRYAKKDGIDLDRKQENKK